MTSNKNQDINILIPLAEAMKMVPEETDIVKVQLPVFATREAEVLIYNWDRSVTGTGPVTRKIAELMGNEPKKFFYFKLEGLDIKLLSEAPWQEW